MASRSCIRGRQYVQQRRYGSGQPDRRFVREGHLLWARVIVLGSFVIVSGLGCLLCRRRWLGCPGRSWRSRLLRRVGRDGNPEGLEKANHWAGQSAALATTDPAGDIVTRMWRDAKALLA
jgi:hypothetical protein